MITLTLLFGVIGLIVGSFLGATVWRIRVKKSIVNDRSICPHCKHVLSPLDLVPLVSWAAFGGKCRYCHKPIGWTEPLIELATAILFALSYLQLRPTGTIGWLEFIIWLYLLGSLIALTVYDLRWMLLPNVIIFPAMAVAALGLVLQVVSGGALRVVTGPLLAALLAGAVFSVLALVADGKLMGWGDVKLVVLMGLMLGLRKLGVALFVGFDTAAIIGIILLLTGIKKRTDHIPFGPFLALGTVVAFLYGTNLLNLYLHLVGF